MHMHTHTHSLLSHVLFPAEVLELIILHIIVLLVVLIALNRCFESLSKVCQKYANIKFTNYLERGN